MNNMHAMIDTIFVGENFVGVILYPHFLRIFVSVWLRKQH